MIKLSVLIHKRPLNYKERLINLKVNLNNISQRAQSFLKNPKFFKEGKSSDFFVTIDDQDRIMTIIHGKNPEDMEFLLAEVVAKFSENKKITDVWKINFREIENFLRDENHLSAFVGDPLEIESILNQIKASLIGFAFKSKVENEQMWIISQRKKWKHLSLTAQNEWALALTKTLGWELIFCENNLLTVTKTPEAVDSEALSDLINTILRGEEIVAPMKVVAV